MFQLYLKQHIKCHSDSIANAVRSYGFKLCLLPVLAACGGGGGDDIVTTPVAAPPPVQFTILTEVNTGGSISPQTATLAAGSLSNFTLQVNTGYVLGSVSGCNGVLNGNIFTVSNLTGNCTLQAQFRAIQISPQALQVQAENQQARISWSQVTQAQNYKVYVAERPFTNLSDLPAVHQLLVVTEPVVLLALDKSYNNYYVRVAAVVDAQEYLSDEQIQVTANFEATGGLNDTAITVCLSNQLVSADCQTNFSQGQDGATGRDALAANGLLTKTGQGFAGFDFTKISRQGKVLPIQDKTWQSAGNELEGSLWSCVRDNVTGLIWEIKQPAGIQASQHTFSWLSHLPSEHNGQPGDSGDAACGLSHCNTAAYIDHLNSIHFCGSNHWRLPQRAELNNILRNASTGPTLDPLLFPDITQDTSYWTNSTYQPFSSAAWAISMNSAILFWQPKSSQLSIRLVHSK